MSGECDKCNEDCLECRCDKQIEIKLIPFKRNYFLTDSAGNAFEVEWDNLCDILHAYVKCKYKITIIGDANGMG
jgi:hypothetical protein